MTAPEDNPVINNSQPEPEGTTGTDLAIDNSHPAQNQSPQPQTTATPPDKPQTPDANRQKEHGGAKGLEPTRYGDWERNGRCTDF